MIFLYIDPGAGSMVVQGLLAAVLAIPFFFRSQVLRVFSRFRGQRADEREESAGKD